MCAVKTLVTAACTSAIVRLAIVTDVRLFVSDALKLWQPVAPSQTAASRQRQLIQTADSEISFGCIHGIIFR
jgi:hypothetical protein